MSTAEWFMRGVDPPWIYRVLRNAPVGAYQFIFIHRGTLVDEPIRRYYQDRVREDVIAAWREHYPDDIEHGRIFWNFEADDEEMRNAVRLSAVLLPDGEHPDQVDHDRRTT